MWQHPLDRVVTLTTSQPVKIQRSSSWCTLFGASRLRNVKRIYGEILKKVFCGNFVASQAEKKQQKNTSSLFLCPIKVAENKIVNVYDRLSRAEDQFYGRQRYVGMLVPVPIWDSFSTAYRHILEHPDVVF